jgi:1,4-dihydroxy-2-naphthoate octaprenyltransferase
MQFDWSIFGLTVLTTVCLQVLSNFANDYGDAVSGVDSSDRKVATRSVQTGLIDKKSMKNAMILMAFVSLLSGCSLLWLALRDLSINTIIGFFGIGILAILAAITYTVGKRPYGYMGFGDISVLIFFGWVGVMGTYFLMVHQIDFYLLLPASACGFFAVCVLNVNNIRDIETDLATGKNSIPARLGRPKAKMYHWFLTFSGVFCAIFYVFATYHTVYQLVFLITIPIFIKLAIGIQKGQNPEDFDPFLKKTALTALLFTILFGIGNLA